MKQDRCQPNVRFEMCERGFLLEVDHGPGLMGTRYAFDRIEGVAAWFVEQYASADTRPQGGDGTAPFTSGAVLSGSEADAQPSQPLSPTKDNSNGCRS